MANSNENVIKTKTLFIGNLPYITTTDVLENAFTEYGPIKSCFVVKGKDGKCKGFGYVAFALREDSEKAHSADKKIGGRKVTVTFANPKERRRRNKKIETSEPGEEPVAENGVVDFDDEKGKESSKEGKSIVPKQASDPTCKQQTTEGQDTKKAKRKKKKKPKIEDEDISAPVSLVVTGLASKDKKSFSDLLSGIKDIIESTFPLPDRFHPTGLITFKHRRAAATALGKIMGKRTQALPIKATFSVHDTAAKAKTRKETEETKVIKEEPQDAKWCKLIIRNLSFKCKEEDLKKAFNEFGVITQTKIPLKPDGKMYGYGFVQFNNLNSAKNAMDQMNAKPILGRPVAVDWALARDKYLAAVDIKVEKEEPKHSKQDNKAEAMNIDGITIKKEVDEEDEEEAKKIESDEDEDNDEDVKLDQGSSNEEEDVEDEDAEDEDADDEDEEDEDEDDEMIIEQGSGSEDEDSNSEDSEMSDDCSDEERPQKTFKKSKPSRPSDVGEGRTVFVRNVSFDTLNDDLEEFMEEYGEIKSCRIVIDPETDHSKGVAFVQFEKKEDADKCVMLANNDQLKKGGLQLDGRRLNVTAAVSREDAIKLKTKPDKEETQKDKRNLWLLREGLIRPGTQAAQGLAKIDLQKREQVEKQKRQKLKNPDVFVSPTRMCVRNIPTSVTDNQLRRLYLKAAGDKTAVVKESRVMRDLQRVNTSGLGKSRGYAFVEFTEHKHALAALRYTNNNPEVFGDNKRLIVEFSLESRSALRTKQERMERSKTKQAMLQRNVSSGDNKMSRGKKKISVSQVQAPPAGVDIKKIPKGMPSHMGAKIRHKPRAPPPSIKKTKAAADRSEAQSRKQKRKAENTMHEPSKKSKPSKNRRGQPKSDNIDSLINKYRTTFKQAILKKGSSKWFET